MPLKTHIHILTLTSRAAPSHHAPALPRAFISRTRPAGARAYATHTERPQSAASQRTEELLGRLQAEARSRAGAEQGSGAGGSGSLRGSGPRPKSGFEGHESVGPFPLGVGPSGRSRTWKRWSEMGLGGKLGRITRQTGNLSVILVGGTLFVVLAFALTTELFATNSPSVLYSRAVDLIRESDALNPHLLPPLTFTHTPHPSAPIRGSPPLPTRHIQHPTSGREHLLLTFWVHGRGIGEEESLGWVRGAYATLLGWGRTVGEWTGVVQEGSQQSETPLPAAAPNAAAAAPAGSSFFGGLFSGLSLRGGPRRDETPRGLPPPGTYKVGEVHGDYVKNASGQYQLLSLVIDVPGSGAAQPSRAVAYWSKEAETEGLLGRRVR